MFTMKKSLYLLATDNRPHTWEEIVAASTDVLEATTHLEEGVYFKQAMSYNKDCAVLWRQQNNNLYIKKKLFVSPGEGV